MRFHLKILTPDAVLLQDHVDSVQVPAEDGVYTILPDHAPIFISLQAGVIAVSQAGEVERWFIDSGTCHMMNNQCTIIVQDVMGSQEVH